MIQPVQGRATLGLSPLVSGAESKVSTSDASVRPRVGKTEQTVVGNDGGKVKMPKAVLPFGDWPPGSEKVDERTGAIQEYKTLSVADQLQARAGANKEVDKSAAPGGGEKAGDGEGGLVRRGGEQVGVPHLLPRPPRLVPAGAALRKLLEAAEHKLEVLVELVEHSSLPCRHSARVLAALQRHEPLTRLAGESTGVLQQRAELPRIVARGLHPRKDAIVPADDPDVLDHLV